MTWFKENKFLAGLVCITSLLAALLIFLGLKAGSSLETVQAEISDKESALEKMKNLDPYPTPDSAKEKKASLEAMLEKANKAREMMVAFRPEAMEGVSGKIFSENLSATVAKVKELFPGEGALPKSFHLGFEGYSGSLPEEGATGVLTYQLGALEYVFQELAAAGVTEIQNLNRVELPAEKGEEWPDAMSAKKSGGGKGKNNAKNKNKGKNTRGKNSKGKKGVKKPAFENLPAIAHRLPFELVFKAPEGPARQFLTQLANSDQYFFETRIGRVFNPSPIPSSGKSASKPTTKKEGDFNMDEMVIEGAEPSMMDKASSKQILNKVSGGDELVIYLRADLLLFIAEKEFPELK